MEMARQLCQGGSDLIQLRAKNLPPGEIRRLAERIQPVVAEAGVGFVINDHPEIAGDVGADFCHLGQEDFFSSMRHSPLPIPNSCLGLSTHAAAQALHALEAGPAYIAIGPVFPTTTKPGVPAVTLNYVRWAAENVRIPWFAIGGITLSNLDDVLSAGARRICVVSAILNAEDVAAACRAFKDRVSA